MYFNHRKSSQYIVPKLDDLIYESQGSHILPSETKYATDANMRTCQSLDKVINRTSVHSPLPEKDLEFLDGVLPKSTTGRDDTDQASLQETDYSYPT